MKKYSYGKLISLSWNWMCTVLFRPFSLKKWIMLGIIVMLAGQLGNFNLSINLKGKGDGIKKPQIQQKFNAEEIKQKIAEVKSIAFKILRENVTFTVLLALAGVSMILIMLLWTFIMSVFSFIFIESLAKDNASVRIPFHKNKPLGTSFFFWNLFFGLFASVVMGALVIFCLISLFKSGVFSDISNITAAAVLGPIMPYLIPAVTALILFLLISIFVIDFVLVIMYSRNVGIIKAWGIFGAFLVKNPAEVLLYLLVKLGLGILSFFVLLAMVIVGILLFLLMGGALALVGFLVYTLMPLAAKAVVRTVLLIIGVPIILVLAFLIRFVFLPLPVFFRLFSIYFLASFDNSFDPFTRCAEELKKGEEDLQKYKKPLSIIWTAIFSPIIPILLMLAAFYVGVPTFIKAAGPEIKAPAIPAELQIKKALPAKRIKKDEVRVYLKNGQSFEASIIRRTPESIAFSVEGGTFTINKEDIENIERKK